MKGLIPLVCLLAGACVHRKPASPAEFPRTVAVVPFANDTASVDAPAVIRTRMEREMRKSGWQVLTTSLVDAALRERGVTLGGQIPSLTHEELRDALRTDAVVTGRVIERSNAVASVSVSAEAVLVDVRSGEVVWYGVERYHDDVAQAAASGGECACGAVAIGCVVSGLDAIFDPRMSGEWGAVARRLCRTLPLPGGVPARRQWTGTFRDTKAAPLGEPALAIAPAGSRLGVRHVEASRLPANTNPGRVIVRTRGGGRSIAEGERVRAETLSGESHVGRIVSASHERIVLRTRTGDVELATADLADLRSN